MSFDDRLGWLILGCLIGFVLGYISRLLQEVKATVDEVESVVKDEQDKGDHGFVRNSLIMDAALLAVIVLTVWASFSSQKASNDVQATQDKIARITYCNQRFIEQTISALNARTEYSQRQLSSNADLQKSQAAFLSVLLKKPPAAIPEREQAFQKYFEKLTNFVTTSARSNEQADANPYPTNDEFQDCLSK